MAAPAPVARASVARHANNFDLIRLFGALQVVLAHGIEHLGVHASVAPWLADAIALFPGVPIFFTVSGYLITASFERSASVREYAWNRFLRIYPALWLCFAVTVAVLAAFGALTPRFLGTTFWPWVAAQLTIGQVFNPDALRSFGIGVVNGSLWTIPVEIGFYVLLPIVLLSVRDWRRRRRALTWTLAVVALLSAGVYAVTSESRAGLAKFVYVTPAPHFWLFLYGALAYVHRERLLPLLRGRFPLWLAAYVVAGLLAPGIGPQNVLTYALLAATVLSAAFTATSLAQRLLRGNDISYGVYIYHMVVVNALLALGLRDAWRYVALTFALTIAAASVSWWMLERPVLQLKRRARTAGTTTATAPATAFAPELGEPVVAAPAPRGDG